MSSGYQLKYRTFDQLVAEAQVDFRNYAQDSMIDPQDLIKVARRVNRDLGLRIHTTKGRVLEIENYRAKLPDDFHVVNYALVCGTYSVTNYLPQGTQVEEVSCPEKTCGCTNPCNCQSLTPQYYQYPQGMSIDNQCPTPVENPCDPCQTNPCSQQPTCVLNKCGESYQLIQVIKTETRTYNEMYPLRLKNSPDIDCQCPNLTWMCKDEGWIKDGWLHTNFKTGKVYISYEGMLEDEDGNLLVPDHEILNEYYEYALKERICENLWFNGEDVERKLGYLQQKLRAARNNALTIVLMPNFEEMKKVWEINRKAQYARYYNMFRSYPPYWEQRNFIRR